MTDFMTDQQIIDNVGCFLPVGQGQHTVIHVEGCSRNRFVLHHKVLSCQQAGKVTFDLLGQHVSLALMPLVYTKKEDPKVPLVQFADCLSDDRVVLDLLHIESSVILVVHLFLVGNDEH